MNNCEWEEMYLYVDFQVGLGWKTGIFPPTHREKQQKTVFPLLSRARSHLGARQCNFSHPEERNIHPVAWNTVLLRVFAFFFIFLSVFFHETRLGIWNRIVKKDELQPLCIFLQSKSFLGKPLLRVHSIEKIIHQQRSDTLECCGL